MSTKIILISLALAQVVWANPIVEDDLCLMKTKYGVLLSSATNKKLPAASAELLIFIGKGLVEISHTYLKAAKPLSEQLLTDPRISDSKSGKIFEFKQNLTKFEENYAKCDGPNALIELVELFSNITSFYFEDDQTNFDDEDKYILELLKKYNYEKLDSEFTKNFDQFTTELVNVYDSLKEDLAKEDLGKNITVWFAQFKTLNSTEDKKKAFGTFIEVWNNPSNFHKI